MVISSPLSFRRLHLIVPVPAMASPLLIPFKTVEDEGEKVIKSFLLLLTLQLAPVSMQMARSLEKRSRKALDV
jgi:hypothetical protein